MTQVGLTDAQLVQAVECIIREVACDPDAAIWLEHLEGGRFGFVVISPGFSDMTQMERQDRLWERIRGTLGADAHRVGPIFPRTPDEVR